MKEYVLSLKEKTLQHFFSYFQIAPHLVTKRSF